MTDIVNVLCPYVANCDANPNFKPTASGGDGSDVQFWFVGFDSDKDVSQLFRKPPRKKNSPCAGLIGCHRSPSRNRSA